MRNLADKAFELSKKHNLRDEVRLIEEEERKLDKFLQRDTSRDRRDLSPGTPGMSPPDLKAMAFMRAQYQ